jgi:hypothetical protein
MINSRQQAYLEAMDIGAWSLREPAPPTVAAVGEAPGLKLGPGSGGVLLICAIDTDSASRLANDIGRALDCFPVWAWPQDNAEATQLGTAVEDNLFTTVAIFGSDLAAQFFGPELPDGLNSAKLVLLPGMTDLQNQARARRTLWATLCRSGMVSQI